MGKANFLFFINTYGDLSQTSTPQLNNVKWSREINGVPFNFENSQQFQVPGSTTSANLISAPFLTFMAGSVGNIASSSPNLLVTGSVAGIVPGLLVQAAGIPANTLIESVGPYQYTFTVSSANATAGAVYGNNGQLFTVVSTIVGGTSLVCTGTGAPSGSGTLTLITGTGDATIAFSAIASAGAVVVMSNAASATTVSLTINFFTLSSFIYIESDQIVSVIYNGGTPMTLKPFQVNGLTQPATFFFTGPSASLTITNPGTVAANIFFASMG